MKKWPLFCRFLAMNGKLWVQKKFSTHIYCQGWSGKSFMIIGCWEVPKPTDPSLLWPAEWKVPAPLGMGQRDTAFKLRYSVHIFLNKYNKNNFRVQNFKNGGREDFEKKYFSSLTRVRISLSSGQNWRPFSPLIGGIFCLKSGHRFSFRALEVLFLRWENDNFAFWNGLSIC